MASQTSPASANASLFERASLAAASAVTAYLLQKCLVSPNPMHIDSSKDSFNKGFLRRSFALLAAYRGMLITNAALNSIASLKGIPAFTQLFKFGTKDLARYPEQINLKLVTWSPGSAALLAAIAGSAALRLRAMRELGKNFTFDLHDPESLITTGIYGCVQHPSYSTLLVAFSLGTVWLVRADGAVGAFLPPALFELLKRYQTGWHIFAALSTAFGFRLRVKDEEKMLKDKFGKQWEEWNARTARFIPFLFRAS